MSSDPAPVEEPVSPDRLWAEQLTLGLFIMVGLLIFMSIYHPKLFSAGTQIFRTNDLPAYGWAAVIGVLLQLVVHEAGTLVAAKVMGLPLTFRFFPLGAHAAAILSHQPRRVWTDAVIGLAGPLTGALASGACAGVYYFTVTEDNPTGYTFPLAMACVGFFYNLFTLIPILDLEGGWIAPAIAPSIWLLGIVGVLVELTEYFNLLLLGVLSFALPRFVQLLRVRTPRVDTALTPRQRTIIGVIYFLLVLTLAVSSSMTFDALGRLIPAEMGD